MTQKTIAISTTTAEKLTNAEEFALQHHLDFIVDPAIETAKNYDYLLVFTPNYLGLQQTKDKKFAPFYIDFLSPTLRYRSKQAGLRKELLARAIGLHPRENPTIVDATAGLGRDSFILATLGFHIIMLERSAILYALLKDALERAKKDRETAKIVERLTLVHTDAITWLTSASPPDVIYLDPMFPERQKSASVKKEMVILQDLLGKDMDSDNLLHMALTCATRRVVIKRPRLAINMSQRTVDFSLMGKSSRFDVYIQHKV